MFVNDCDKWGSVDNNKKWWYDLMLLEIVN